MPETIRAKGGGLRVDRQGGRHIAALCLSLLPTSAHAQTSATDILNDYLRAFSLLQQHEIAALALILGVLFFAVVTAILLVRTYARAEASEARARDRIAGLQGAVDRLTGLLLSDPRILVSWPATGDQVDIIGDTTTIAPELAVSQVLAFAAWLDAEPAQKLAFAVERLRAHGESFTLLLTTTLGRHVTASGRVIGGRAVLKLREVSGIEHALADLAARHEKLKSDADALRTLVEALPAPVWLRDHAGRLAGANAAYAHAVDAPDAASAVARHVELLDRSAREELANDALAVTAKRLPAIIAGSRRILDVLQVPTAAGSAAIGIDVTEVAKLRTELTRMVDAHRRTLDQLATGVAIFGADQKLTFYNEAYRMLWNLDADFLDQGVTDSAVLDRLRANRSLPEQPDFRQWKKQLHEAYRAIEANRQEWHLPDGRTLRVVTTPNPEGGVTYLFDDVTERLDLERRFDALINVQGETLDNLAEALAVFGSDGRVRLFNPAFVRLWKLDGDLLAKRPHIENVIDWCRPLHGEAATWRKLRAAVTALDQRDPIALRIERNDGGVVDCATVPLPDGGTLVAFEDVTDSVNVERALLERNQALIAADELKLDFVHHVSYELRSPLTNIIGFADLLGNPATGPLTERQHEYLDYITKSTNALLALINNILDLATIDAGAMTLDLAQVDIKATMQQAAEGVQDRLIKDNLKLEIHATPGIGSFTADERLLRQVLFNLLSNAVGFSPSGGTITLAAERRNDAIVFSVTDNGPGIPLEMKDKVFGLFETFTLGSQHRGSGLGLSIVRSFVELHGGSVHIDSAVGRGTTVVCTFPLDHAVARSAAQ